MLAQVLLEQPKMSNHARGLWGYTGRTPAGDELTIQSTGIGGPSAAVVLTDLAELGVRRAIRVGTCTALVPDLGRGELIDVTEAHAWGGPGGGDGGTVRPNPELSQQLTEALGESGRAGVVASLDTLHVGGDPAPVELGEAADMQTAAVLSRAQALGVAAAAVLVVTESASGERLDEECEQAAAERAGVAASKALSAST